MSEKLQIADIQCDPQAQSRVKSRKGVIKDYCELMKRGTKLPPVTVFYDGKVYRLADGYHRIQAARQAEFEEIDADVKKGTLRDAIKFSLSANQENGLRRTNSDKRNAVEKALNDKEWCCLKNTEIADMCGVAEAFVRKIKEERKSHNANFSPKEPKPKSIILQNDKYILFLDSFEAFPDNSLQEEQEKFSKSASRIIERLEVLKASMNLSEDSSENSPADEIENNFPEESPAADSIGENL